MFTDKNLVYFQYESVDLCADFYPIKQLTVLYQDMNFLKVQVNFLALKVS